MNSRGIIRWMVAVPRTNLSFHVNKASFGLSLPVKPSKGRHWPGWELFRNIRPLARIQGDFLRRGYGFLGGFATPC